MWKAARIPALAGVPAVALVAAIAIVGAAGPGRADSGSGGAGTATTETGMMGKGLVMPSLDAARGRKLFASKGCVVCHSINGVGGEDAPELNAAAMPMPMNPFDFTARMWRGAPAMIAMQREEIGEQIQFSGAELGDIIAFAHDADEQKKFSEADIPPRIVELMEHMEEMEGSDHAMDSSHMANKPKP